MANFLFLLKHSNLNAQLQHYTSKNYYIASSSQSENAMDSDDDGIIHHVHVMNDSCVYSSTARNHGIIKTGY